MRTPLDRDTRLALAATIVERTRAFSQEAWNELFDILGDIERRHDLVIKFTPEDEAVIAEIEAKIARGEVSPVRKLEGPIEDFLPVPHHVLLERLHALRESEQDMIFGIIDTLIEIDAPPLLISPEDAVEIRRSLKEGQ